MLDPQPQPQPQPAPTQSDLLQSLLSAADATQQAYLTAQQANPGADLSVLYKAEAQAQTLYFTALNKTFSGDAAAAGVQTNLDKATQAIKSELGMVTGVATWTTLVGNVLQLATSVAGFFA